MAWTAKTISNDLFNIETDAYGWVITHKISGKRMGINYNEIPKNSSDDFVFGYAKCLARMEHWV